MGRIAKSLMLLVAGAGCAASHCPSQPASAPAPVSVAALAGRRCSSALGDGFLKLEVCADDVVRVAYAKDQAFFARKSLAAQPKRCEGAQFEVTEGAGTATLATSKLRVRIDLATGRVAFFDPAGTPVLEEKEGGRTLMARDRPGRGHAARAARVARPRRRGALRSRREPARSPEPEGIRPRPLAAQRHHRDSLPGFEPRLGHPVGQHLLHPIRRSARARADPGRAPLRRQRQARRPHRVVLPAARISSTWLASAWTAASTSRCRAKRRNPTSSSSPACPKAPPACAGRARSSRKSPATTPSRPSRTTASSSGSTIGWSSTIGGKAGCPGRTWPRCGSKPSAATRSGSSGSRIRGNGDGAAAVENRQPPRSPVDLALVRSRRRHRLLLRLRSRTGQGRRGLPAHHRAGADDPALGAGALAKPAALRDGESQPRRRGWFPLPRHPLRQHRAGLVLLERRQLGLARVRQARASPIPMGGSAPSTTSTRAS